MKRFVLISLSVILIFLIFFTGFFINKNNLTSKFNFFINYFGNDLYKENSSLKLENENLKAQLEKFQIFNSGGEFLGFDKKYTAAHIFSTYPFNIKNILAIDKGAVDGIKKGMGVIANSGIFLGEISDVSKNSAFVRTVFDPNWQLPVKIGENKINGLFIGGNDPKITLIEKPVKEGDGVFLSSKDFPLNLKIGDISQIRQESGGVFKEAAVQIPYNISELDTVYLIK